MPPDHPPPDRAPWYAREEAGWIPVLGGLHGAGILAPGLQVASSFPDYFTHYHCDALDLLLYLGVLSLAPLLLVGLLRRVLPAWAGEAATVAMALVLATVLGGHLLVRLPGGLGEALGGRGLLAAALALCAPLLYAVRRRARGWGVAVVGAVLWLAAPVAFLAGTGILVHLGREAEPAGAPPPRKPVPVLFVVLDELPTSTLMAPDGTLDAARFPGLASLAETATWYPGTTTVHSYTKGAIPGLLTGRYPAEARLPIAKEYPQNLLRMLAAHLPVVAYEGGSSLYERSLGPAAGAYRSRWNRLAALAKDAVSMVATLLVPDPSGREVLEVARNFDFFRHGQMTAGQARGAGFQGLSRAIRDPSLQRPGLFYLHTTLPHGPYHYAPGGGIYAPYDPAPVSLVPRPAYGGGVVPVVTWSDDVWLVRHAYQRHVLQAMCADALLGRLLETWKARPDFHESLVVVTSDHGNVFFPGAMARYLEDAAPRRQAEALGVPLFIKYPGQIEARVDPRPAETVDIVPTLARALGLDLPGPVDGRPLQDPEEPGRVRRAYDVDQREVVHRVTLEAIRAVSEERRAWFHHLAPGAIPWPYRLDPLGHLAGTPVPASPGPPVRARLDLVGDRPASRGGLEGLLGELHFEDPARAGGPTFLAASHGGEFVGATRLVDGSWPGRRFLILFPARPGVRPADFGFWVATAEGELHPIQPEP